MNRRDLLSGVGALAVVGIIPGTATQAVAPIPIIDTHIHLFDANRPQGAPYTGPKEFSSHVSLPADYRRQAAPLGITGAIAVEASFWIEDNLWLLETAQSNDIMVGVVGWLQPEKTEFREYFQRFHKNPLYRGIRLRGKNVITDQLTNPLFIDNLRLVSQADLVLDTANPDINLLKAVVRLNDLVPDLRIIIDHLPVMEPTPAEATEYLATLDEIRQRPSVFVKLSEILHRNGDHVAKDLAAHQMRLDLLMKTFGPDRVLFGSDYPNSVGTATLPEVLGLVQAYFAKQPRAVAENYFWRNSARCYKWIRRSTDQPIL